MTIMEILLLVAVIAILVAGMASIAGNKSIERMCNQILSKSKLLIVGIINTGTSMNERRVYCCPYEKMGFAEGKTNEN